ncbi:MAG: uracil-DNA glycosylase [SAR202 cluster bacterium MP-SInd-SRR3963457-G2]|jgi:DNA polymerase|nr:MAG: uracil-DNA glycosylase [SAR202 cluster bacterium]PKB77438.1 MAG: uracil-DNA glycosylase [SAR202 cluster bacterium MP-SInd-SRR3963457-G2]HIM80780.1 uracil-DNA glycosylase [Dehalococcoidia bacterium]|tara:strand:+ start:1628 stop:2251 length:624 start_codon:yes stop_codon:yes gene_type:complete
MNSLDEIARLVRQCSDCELGRGRKNAVPGEGSPDADLMIIGEGPGAQEDLLGRPFVGRAGQFLDELLGYIGLKREDVFIANMVKCRPPENRDPLPAEVSACDKYLERQIELLDPLLIVTLGRVSLARFFPGESMTRARGKVREKDGRFIYPVMHPAAALYRQEVRPGIIEDFKAIPKVLDNIRNSSAAPTLAPAAESPPAQQLSLFE